MYSFHLLKAIERKVLVWMFVVVEFTIAGTQHKYTYRKRQKKERKKNNHIRARKRMWAVE